MFVILPFEQAFYKRFKMDVSFVGHPLMDSIEALIPNTNFREANNLSNKPIIALLPGSRKQEISRMLPVMLEAVEPFTNHQLVIAGAPSLPAEYYLPFIKDKNVAIVFDQTYHLLQQAHVAAVTSGTATLETGLFGVPLVVCYKGEQLSYLLAKKLINVKYISLVNLILDRAAVPELIQADMNAKNLSKHLRELTSDSPERAKQLEELSALRLKCGGTGASARTALGMFELLVKN
jgi:lipid-A-disaccharide synthase